MEVIPLNGPTTIHSQLISPIGCTFIHAMLDSTQPNASSNQTYSCSAMSG